VLDRIWPRLAPAMDPPMGDGRLSTLDDYYDVRVLAPGEPETIAGLQVRCRFTGHPIPTIGLLLSDGARTLGWSGDTPYEKAHIDWLSEADIIVHESNRGIAHTPIEDLNALPREIRSRMRLVHLPDDFNFNCTDIAALREGDVVTV
jgi:hypothetical protein